MSLKRRLKRIQKVMTNSISTEEEIINSILNPTEEYKERRKMYLDIRAKGLGFKNYEDMLNHGIDFSED